MSEWYALLFVAVALYLIECLAWIEAPAIACFRSPLRGNWRCAQGSTLPGNERGGLALVAPLHFRGALAVCHFWPFSFSPEGITNSRLDGTTPPAVAEPSFVAFDEIQSVRADFSEIRVNDKLFARVSSSVLAYRLVAQIQRISKYPAPERQEEIKAAVKETLDDEAVAAMWAMFQRRTRTLSACCSGLFAYTFVVCPFVLFMLGPFPSWKFLLIGWIASTVGISIAYFRTHAEMYPECRYDRWVHALSMMLLPVSAIRCIDKLARERLCLYSSVVVAPILCGVENAVPVVRQKLIDVRNGAEDDDAIVSTGAADDCAHWFSRLVAAEIEATLARLKVPVLKPPLPEDETMVSYCPRCHAQFRQGASEFCPECPRVRLVAFDSERVPANSGA